MPEIVKVQRPLASSHQVDPHRCLVYDQARQRTIEQLVDDKVLSAIGSDLKGYFSATWGDRGWQLGERVADQPW